MPSLTSAYLPLKGAVSRALASADPTPRAQVPTLGSPAEVSQFITKHLRWTGDKWWMDAYIHPEILQGFMEMGLQPLHVDCDDFAAWCFAALSKLPGEVKMWTVMDFWLAASHVVCTYREPSGSCWSFSNGAMRPIPSDDATAVMLDVQQEFSDYRWARWWPKPRFVEAVETHYPFDSPR